MSPAEKHLIEGEKVVYTTRLHWVVLLGSVFFGVLLLAAGAALGVYLELVPQDAKSAQTALMIAAGVLLLIGLLWIAGGFLKRNATRITVTNMRVIARVGIATLKTVELLLSRIESIGVEQSVMGRMLGYGTVVIRGTGGTPESFDKIADPLHFRTEVQGQIAKFQPQA